MTLRNSLAYLILVIATLASLTKPTQASNMTVSPAFLRFSVSQKSTTSTKVVSIKNDGDSVATYKATIVNVDTEQGTLMPLGTTSDEIAKTFKISSPEVTIKARSAVEITVTANNITELSPGGHYASLYLQQINNVKSNLNLPVNQVISVGLFLTKEDGAVRDLVYKVTDKKNVWFILPKSINLTINNNGNVDLVPRGFVSIVKGTKTYKKILINETSQPVFPFKSKQYKLNLKDTGIFWPGKYSKITSLRYDGQSKQNIDIVSVWYVPLWFVLLVPSLIVVIFLRYKSIFGHKIYIFNHKSKKHKFVNSINNLPKEGSKVNKKRKSRSKKPHNKNDEEPKTRKVGVL